jgi:hypothetical protein
MTYIDSDVRKLIECCPLLDSKPFVKEHPGIINVALYLNEVAGIERKMGYSYRPFDEMGIGDVAGYLKLVNAGNPRALDLYRKAKSILGF